MARVSVRAGAPRLARMPAVGLGLASHRPPPGEREAELLRALAPAHVRHDARVSGEGWRDALAAAAETARGLGCGLELALVSPEPLDAGADVGRSLAGAPPVVRVLALGEGQTVTSGDWIEAARQAAGEAGRDALFAAGSNAYFTELNRDWGRVRGAPAIVYPITPQVHAFDDRSLLETPPMQALTVRTARARAPGSAVLVGPITLRPRSNPLAAAGGDGAPPEVDERQPSLLAAAWTLGSLAALAGAGARACTFFETTGPRGVMEAVDGERPGMVFPAFHVLADAAAARGTDVLDVDLAAGDPPCAAALALRGAGGLRVMVANLTAEPLALDVDGLPDVAATSRVLDEASAPAALLDPLPFRARAEPAPVRAGRLATELAPYACLTLTAQ